MTRYNRFQFSVLRWVAKSLTIDIPWCTTVYNIIILYTARITIMVMILCPAEGNIVARIRMGWNYSRDCRHTRKLQWKLLSRYATQPEVDDGSRYCASFEPTRPTYQPSTSIHLNNKRWKARFRPVMCVCNVKNDANCFLNND